MSSVFGVKLKQPSRRLVYARAWHTPSVPDPVCPPRPEGATPLLIATLQEGPPAPPYTQSKSTGWLTMRPGHRSGPQPQHRSLFLCSSTPATDRSTSPLCLPPLAAGKGHLRLGGGATHGTLASVASSRGLHTGGGSRPCCPWFLCPLPTSLRPPGQMAVAVFGPALGFPVHSFFILSFPRVLPETLPHTHTSQPLGSPLSLPLV